MERRETGARLGAESAGSNSSIPLLKAGESGRGWTPHHRSLHWSWGPQAFSLTGPGVTLEDTVWELLLDILVLDAIERP